MHFPLPTLRLLAALSLFWGAALATAQAAEEPGRVGVNAAVNTDASGTPPGGATRKLVIGEGVVHNERITTDANGQTQILFIDGSSISVGPSSDMTIDDFVYDPSTGTGKMTLTELQGAMRFVGGKLSKQDNAVTLHMGAATIGVRGGVFLASVKRGGNVEIIFVYGKAVTVTSSTGVQELFRPGFAVDISPSGIIGPPHPVPPGVMVGILTQLDGRAGGHGGATTVPTDATVANSPIPNTISNNVQVSVQQSQQNSSTPNTATPAPPTTSPPQVPVNQVQTTSTSPAIPNSPPPTPPKPPTPPTPPPPVTTSITGAVKFGLPSGTGFVVPAVLPYTGTITYPSGSGTQNATLNGNIGSGVTFTLTPLLAGGTVNTTATAFLSGQAATDFASGPATLNADGSFFFANTVTSVENELLFFFGGTAVAQSFYKATSAAPQFYAFKIQPDYSLANGSQPQTIPFLPPGTGGTMPNAAVSPLMVVNNANTPFGSHNNNSNPGALNTEYLQASLAINGAGVNQTSALAISTGEFIANASGQVDVSGGVRGTVFTSATGPLQTVQGSVSSVTDGTGNSLYGNNSIEGFVLDQNLNENGTYNPTLANAKTYQSGVGFTPTTYGFNQPVTATNVPSGIGATRTALNETGYFGGLMQCCSTNATTNAIINYGLAGNVSLQTDPATSRVKAIFAANAPFIAVAPRGLSPLAFSGLDALTLQFGSLSSDGENGNRSTFIDNSTFAARESPDTASSITRTISTGLLTTTLPLPASSDPNSASAPALALVTSTVVANNALVPSGLLCQCQYSQWGFWTGTVMSPNTTAGFAGTVTNDVASINTWIAGQPTTNMPTSAIGNYSGSAIGTVYNNGAQYLATGGFSGSYNFATNSGTVTLSNFDGNTLTGIVNASSGGSPSYSGSISGNNLIGFVDGTFYGPGAAETGGNFGFYSQSGANYGASGIYDAASTGTSSTLPSFTSYMSGATQSVTVGTTSGFTGLPTTFRDGTITYNSPGSQLANGMASATVNGKTYTLSTLTPGETNGAISATTSTGGSASGTATMSADGNFFFASLVSNDATPDNVFVFGGVPVNQNFYAPNPNPQVLAFNVQPDIALGTTGKAQTIPFLPAGFGGQMANANVSPLYVTVGKNSPFGLQNSTNEFVGPKILQASLAINGQGASQTAAFVIATGNFFEASDTSGFVNVGGPVRGAVMLGGTSSPVHIGSGLSASTDASGNALFGGSTIDGFMLNQNSFTFSGNFNPQTASASQFGQTTFNYGFSQPVTAAPAATNPPPATQGLNETGFFGGLMTFSSNTSTPGNPYALNGTLTLQANANNNRIVSTFTGGDPFTTLQSRINSKNGVVLAFGDNTRNTNESRATYVNQNIYGMTDSPINASSINGNPLPLPPNSTSSTPSPSIGMVTVATLGSNANSWMPAGVAPCSCQYLQWGYWTGQLPSTTSQGLMTNRTDRSYINTWLAGQPTVTMPTSGTGTYNGAAVGTVFNAGNSYLAAGQFNANYNFGLNTGTVNINNFDGASYSSSVTPTGSGNTYSGKLTGVANRTGNVNGGFFGPSAAETGGSFGIQSLRGSRYIASGIFAGR